MNGVAELHSQLVQSILFPDFVEFYGKSKYARSPSLIYCQDTVTNVRAFCRFSNVTNGSESFHSFMISLVLRSSNRSDSYAFVASLSSSHPPALARPMQSRTLAAHHRDARLAEGGVAEGPLEARRAAHARRRREAAAPLGAREAAEQGAPRALCREDDGRPGRRGCDVRCAD